MVIYIFQCYFLNLSHPLLPLLCPQSVLYVSVSTPALQRDSSVSQINFPRCHMYLCYYMIFAFLFQTSFCITGSRFIYLKFLPFLWLNNVSLYICTTTSLSIHLSMDIQVTSVSQLLQIALLCFFRVYAQQWYCCIIW